LPLAVADWLAQAFESTTAPAPLLSSPGPQREKGQEGLQRFFYIERLVKQAKAAGKTSRLIWQSCLKSRTLWDKIVPPTEPFSSWPGE